jgi:archaellum biogenesis ATPase FlaH
MIKDYGIEVQKLYLELMLADAEVFVRCQGIFDHTLFDRKLQDAAEFMNEYAKGYNVLPDFDMVNASCRTDLKRPEDMKEGHMEDMKEGHMDWLLDEFENFTRHKALERAIISSAELLENKNYGEVEALIKEAVQIGLARDMGTDYFADPRARLMGLKDKNGQVSTGWPCMDRKLFGGFNRGELNIFAGGSGAGKSLFLANLGVNFALAGLNVVYLTLELSEALVSMRIDSMVTGVSTREIFKNLDDIEMKVKMIGKKSGMLQVKYMPSGKTVNDIRAYLKEYEIKCGKKVDVLLVDYMDLLMPIGKKISAENLFVKDKYVSEELRNLAMEKQCVFVTAAQLNRGAVEEVEFDHSHISGGLSKIQTADNVIGIFTSRAMRERGRYQLQLMKTRSSSGVGMKIDLEFNIETLKISDLPEDEQESNGATSRGSSSLIESIKNRSTIKADPETGEIVDPTQGSSLGRVRGSVQSTKLREILNSMNDEE